MRFVRAPLRRRDRNAGAANPATVETQSIAGAGGGICPQGYVLVMPVLGFDGLMPA